MELASNKTKLFHLTRALLQCHVLPRQLMPQGDKDRNDQISMQ